MHRERRFSWGALEVPCYATKYAVIVSVADQWLGYRDFLTIRSSCSHLRSSGFLSSVRQCFRRATAFSYIMERASLSLTGEMPATPHWQLTRREASYYGVSGFCAMYQLRLQATHTRHAVGTWEDRDDLPDGDRLLINMETGEAVVQEQHLLWRMAMFRLEPALLERMLKSVETVQDLQLQDARNPLRWGRTAPPEGVTRYLPPLQQADMMMGAFLDLLGSQIHAGLRMVLEQTRNQLCLCDWMDLPTRSYELPPASVWLMADGTSRLA